MRKPDFFDAIAVIGLAMLGYGIYLISLPVALIIIGVMLVTIGIVGAKGKPS